MRFFSNLSLRYKLISVILIVTVSAVLVCLSAVTITNIKSFKNDLKQNITINSKLIAEYSIVPLTFNDIKGVKDIFQKSSTIDPILFAVIFDKDKNIFATYSKTNEYSEEQLDDKIFLSSEPIFENNYLYICTPIAYKDVDYGFVYLKASTEALRHRINDYLLMMLALFAALVFVSYFLALKLQNIISAPILQLASITKKISEEGDYSLRAQKLSSDEIGELYDRFNDMISQVEKRTKDAEELNAELEQKNKELEQIIYITSHDLRSPLVNVQGFSKEIEYSLEQLKNITNELKPQENIKQKINSIISDDISEYFEFIRKSISKMDTLLSSLLKLSRLGRSALNIIDLNMNKIISDIIGSSEFLLKDKNIEILSDKLPPCKGDPAQINQLFTNLVENAIKYMDASRHGLISISGGKSGNYSLYCVRDNGIGIKKEHQSKVFEIFHRIHPEKTSGEGLGLSIVTKIARRHNGKVWLESKPGEGSSFFVQLPEAKKGDSR